MSGLHRRQFVAAAAWATLGRPTAAAGTAHRSATDLAAALRSRQISSLEVVDNCIARIERLDGELNAVCVRDFDRARAAARAADAARARGDDRPLLGLPLTVKESIDVAGLPTTWGQAAYRERRATQDALAVARLKAAGAVVLGKTNVALMLSDWQSDNPLYGRSNNPWDAARTPGGSSGGSAAALAAGFGSLSLGTDLGGSLRVPAHFCGICAHRPSLGLVPVHDQMPPTDGALPRDETLVLCGPMARSAADLGLALDTLAAAEAVTLPPPRHTRLAGCRVLLLDRHPLGPTSGEVAGALGRLAERLVRAGAHVAHGSPLLPRLEDSTRVFAQLLMADAGARGPGELHARVRAIVAGLPETARTPAAERARALVMSYRDWVAADATRRRLRTQWTSLFEAFDVLLCPPFPTTAFPHDATPSLENRRLAVDTASVAFLDAALLWPGLAGVPGLPATVLPIERSASGLPVGVQVIGPSRGDRTTIAFATAMEQEFGGFVAPPGFGAG